jgi:hypothetical protein
LFLILISDQLRNGFFENVERQSGDESLPELQPDGRRRFPVFSRRRTKIRSKGNTIKISD